MGAELALVAEVRTEGASVLPAHHRNTALVCGYQAFLVFLLGEDARDDLRSPCLLHLARLNVFSDLANQPALLLQEHVVLEGPCR